MTIQTLDSARENDIEKAKEICSSCAELNRCRNYADSLPMDALVGVVAGAFARLKG
jgi:hypothetical protein